MVADSGSRQYLDQVTDDYILTELPRLAQLIEERCADVEARGCTHPEAVVIAHQVIEEQRRTIDDVKRHRLTNVLVNGLCDAQWQMAKHRLMVRYAGELEEEHVARLRTYVEVVSTDERLRRDAERMREQTERNALPRDHELVREHQVRYSVQVAIARELISRNLLEERREPKPFARPVAGTEGARDAVYAEKDLVSATEITRLGRLFLDYLRDPELLPAP